MSKILVIPRVAYLDSQISPPLHGLQHAINTHGQWMNRDAVEHNEDWLQPIPYIMVTNREGDLFGYTRLRGDQRLVAKTSYGVGGHVDEGIDGELPNSSAVAKAAFRELDEELQVGRVLQGLWPMDVIERNDTHVDRVHIGILYHVQVESATVKETESLEGRFFSRAEIAAPPSDSLEGWSRDVRRYYLERTH